MRRLVDATTRVIARLEAELAAEDAAIAAAVAARRVAGGDYWKKRHLIERRIAAAHALREVFAEVAE